MRLKSRNTEPIGGWKYKYQDSFGNWYAVEGVSLNDLVNRTRFDMRNNNVSIPQNLQLYIEDYICARLPDSKCVYELKAGDQIARVAHKFAGGADATLGLIGIKSNLKKSAKRCSTCGQRRNKLNGY